MTRPEPSPVLGEFSACGKLILFGEHFVVYGCPALALPLTSLSTDTVVERAASLKHPELALAAGEPDQTAERLLTSAAERLGVADQPWRVRVSSSIPIGFGLGSSAALSVALLGALSQAARRMLTTGELNDHAYALEQLVHGAPSGVDNTVITHRCPVWLIKERPLERLETGGGLRLVAASSGVPGSTREEIARVRRFKDQDRPRFEELCRQARVIAEQGRQAILAQEAETLGALMDQNHQLLCEVGVSTDDLDRLVTRVRQAGALGAKLTGSGGGGFMVAVTSPAAEPRLKSSLLEAGAATVFSIGG